MSSSKRCVTRPNRVALGYWNVSRGGRRLGIVVRDGKRYNAALEVRGPQGPMRIFTSFAAAKRWVCSGGA